MTSSQVQPPEVLGLRWGPAEDPLILRSNVPWGHYATAVARAPYPAGMSEENVAEARDPNSGGRGWPHSVAFRAHLANQAEIDAWAVAVAVAHDGAVIDHLKQQRQQRQEAFDRAGAPFAAYAKTLRSQAEADLKTWGPAFQSAEKVREILAVEILLHGELKKLNNLLRANARKQKNAMDRVACAETRGHLECSDDVIVEAIIALTGLDTDERQLPNNEGWSSSTGPTGHWCHAMLGIDRDLAIKEGRRLIAAGGHEAQLKRLGIDVGSAS